MTAFKAAIRPHETDVAVKAWDAAAVVAALGDDPSVSDLRGVFAWVDPAGEPDVKGSYRFPHHHGPGGPANVKACVAGIAALNGARAGTSIPEGDRQGVYEHLAAHLRDADREPPALGTKGDGMKFNDEMALVLCEVDSLIDRASEVVALRAKKGRTPLSAGSTELLEWLGEDLRRLKSLMGTPEDELAREYVRFVQQRHRRAS